MILKKYENRTILTKLKRRGKRKEGGKSQMLTKARGIYEAKQFETIFSKRG